MKNWKIHWLTVLGCLAVIAALIGLETVPDRLQYAFLTEDKQSAVLEKTEETIKELADPEHTVTVHALRNDVSLSAERGGSEKAALYMVGMRWNEVYPRQMITGEPINNEQVRNGTRAIVLDEKLAFRLLGDREYIGSRVSVAGNEYEVTGIAKHSHGLGDLNDYMAWIPMGTEEAAGSDLYVLSTAAGLSGAFRTVFGNAAEAKIGAGELYSTAKEKMGSRVILRLLLLVIGVRLLLLWVRRLRKLGSRWLAEYRERLKVTYARKLTGFLLARVLVLLLCLAAAVGAGWVLAKLLTDPMLVFTEWVPEELVSFDSIADRFRELTKAAARTVSLSTPELAVVRFWGGLLQWGVILALLGCAMSTLNGWIRGRQEKQDRLQA